VLALASPASLKGVLGAPAAAEALAEGMRAGGASAELLPVADGGEGTADVLRVALGGERHEALVADAFGEEHAAHWLVLPDGTAVVEAAAAVPFEPARLDPLAASSRGFGELVRHALDAGARALVLCLGGTATMDGGSPLRESLPALPAGTVALCDVRTTLWEAPRVFGPQKGATPEDVAALERRFALLAELVPYAELEGAGAAGGLGAALAALGAELVPGANWVLRAIGFDERLGRADLVVTGEGRVDASTRAGKAPAAVAAAARAADVRCVVFGGVVEAPLPEVETVALSGDPAAAADDLRALGRDVVADSN
jgi:glycerate 2-kinase